VLVIFAVTITFTVPQRLASASTPVAFLVTVVVRDAAAAWATGMATVRAQSGARSFDLMHVMVRMPDERRMGAG
jgi:hypothetical protein